jgi:hypothetical protein
MKRRAKMKRVFWALFLGLLVGCKSESERPEDNKISSVKYFQEGKLIKEYRAKGTVSRHANGVNFIDMDGNEIKLPLQGTVVEELKNQKSRTE